MFVRIYIYIYIDYYGVKRAPPHIWAASAGPEDHNSEVKLHEIPG